MKVTIYRSKYNWKDTLSRLNLTEYSNQNVEIGSYYALSSFEIAQPDSFHDGALTKLTVLPIAKKKKRMSTSQQNTLDGFVNKYNSDYANFSPEKGGNLDTILLVKQAVDDQKNVYLIPFGQGFRKVEEVADSSFGIDFAEREVRETDVITKHVNFFGQDKTQAITNYRRTSRDVALPSEAYTSITAHPSRIDMYGNSIVCALGVSLNVKSTAKEGFEKGLCEVVRNIDDLMHSKTLLSKFPRIQFIKDKLSINSLNIKLTNMIKNRQVSLKPIQVEVPDTLGNKNFWNFEPSISLLSFANISNIVVFLEEMTDLKLFIKGSKKKTQVTIPQFEKYDVLSQIGDILQKNSSSSIEEVILECADVAGNTEKYKVKQFISAEIVNNEKPYVLQNGRWGTLNSEFFSLIDTSLKDIEVKCNEQKFNVDFGINEIDNVSKGSEEDYMNALKITQGKNLKKIHKHFAKPNSKNFIYRGPGVELADMYDSEENELLTMKNGESTATTLYSLEQSMLGLSIVNNPTSYDNTEIQIALGSTKLDKVLNARNNGIIWIFPVKDSNGKSRFNNDRTLKIQNNSFDLRQLGSILVKAKLSEWSQYVNETHQKPVIHMVTPRDMSR